MSVHSRAVVPLTVAAFATVAFIAAMLAVAYHFYFKKRGGISGGRRLGGGGSTTASQPHAAREVRRLILMSDCMERST